LGRLGAWLSSTGSTGELYAVVKRENALLTAFLQGFPLEFAQNAGL